MTRFRGKALAASVCAALALTVACTLRVPASGSAFVDETDVEATIRATADAFTEAFNKGDAAAIGALWGENAEYIDEAGQHTHGRAAIQKEYADFFAQNPGLKIKVQIDSIKMVGEYTAIEDGQTTVSRDPENSPVTAYYKAVHVKRDGQWEMASVMDYPVPEDPSLSHVEDLDWLVGEWTASNDGVDLSVTCKWIAGERFLERSWEASQAGEIVSSGKQIIGWDPSSEQLTSWSFTSDGGHAVGAWVPQQDGWGIESVGVLADGTATYSIETMSSGGEDQLSWTSTERFVEDVQIPNTSEVVLERQK